MKRLLTYSFFICIFTVFATFSEAPNPSWLTKITHEAGLDSARGGRIWVADVNNDNYPDLFWGEGGVNRNHLYLFLNVPNPDKTSPIKRIFVNWTDSSGITVNRDETKKGRIVDIMAAADVNNDGNIDIVTSIYYHRLQYYQNPPDPGDRTEVLLGDGKGHFTLKKDAGTNNIIVDDTLSPGLINATGMAYLDYDYDGILDLYISTWFTDYAAFNGVGTNMPDVMLKGNGDGSFTHIKTIGLQNVVEPEYGVNVTDYDNDGWQDIITSPYCRSGGALFKNTQNGRFANYTSVANYSAQKLGGDHGQNLCQWSAQPGDVNNDGNMDLLQVEVHGGYNDGEGRTHIAINGGYKAGYAFQWDLNKIVRDAPIESHLGDQGGNWIDLDNDGWLDCLIGQSAYPAANLEGQERLYVCRQDTDGVLKDISKALGLFHTIKEAHTPIPVDFDLDGDQDILVSHTIRDTQTVDDKQVIKVWTQIELLRNDIGNKNNWAAFKLKPTLAGTNKTAIGARISTSANGLNMMRELQAGVGHFAGQMPFIQNFGIAGKHYIDSVTVRWPRKDLLTSVFKYPPINCISELDDLGRLKVFIPSEAETAGIIAFNKPVMDFDTVNVGKDSTISFFIKNLGDNSLTIMDMKFDSKFAEHYSFDNPIPMPFVIMRNDSAHFRVKFKPTRRGDFSTNIILTTDAYNSKTAYVDIQSFGFKKEPMIATETNSIFYGSVFIDSSKTMSFVISNQGELPLEIQKFTIDNNTDNAYVIDSSTLPLTLQSKEFKLVHVQFSPKQEKEYKTKVIVQSNAYNEPNLEVQLLGMGDVPRSQIKVVPGLFFMGATMIGVPNDRAFQIFNEGNGELKVSSITLLDATMNDIYTFPGANFPIILKPSDSSSLTLRFTPKEEKAYNTKMQINSNDPDAPSKQLSLKGTGVLTSVTELGNENDNLIVSVLPNPFSGSAKIKISVNSSKSKYIKLKATDVFGRNLQTFFEGIAEIGITEKDLDLNNVSSGMYYLVIESDGLVKQIPLGLIR